MKHFHLIGTFWSSPKWFGYIHNFFIQTNMSDPSFFCVLATNKHQSSCRCMIFNWECMSSNIFFLKFLQDIFGRMPMLLSSVSLEWSCWPHYCHSNISLWDTFSWFFSFNSWISYTIMCIHLDFLTFVLFPPRTTIDHFTWLHFGEHAGARPFHLILHLLRRKTSL